MKPVLLAGAIALALQGCNQPQQQNAAPPPASSPAASTEAPAGSTGVYTTTGQITEVTPDSVTINHQPVPALNWPSMTMTFRASDSAMIAGLQQGASVEFSFRQDGAQNVLTEIKPR
jgi:Cu(I)/Ag(I) efflux system membrane fusion protein